MTDIPDLSKLLPTHLQTGAGSSRREHIERRDVAGGTLTLERVELQRGWRYEINAEYDAIDAPIVDRDGRMTDAGGPVRRRDTLWLPDYDQAQRVMRAARAPLASRTFEASGGLSQLAREVGATFDVQ